MSLSNIKVLLLNVNREGWHSGNMIYDMEAIKRACDVQFYGPGFPNYKHTDIRKIIDQIYGSGKPDVIYSYFTENETVRDCYVQQYEIPESLRRFHHNFKDIKGIPKIFALSDFWARNPKKFTSDLVGSTFQYCFCCFAPPYSDPKDFYTFFNRHVCKEIKFIGYPRCVDKDCFRDYGLPKNYDVITLGAMWGFYPLRTHMHKYLSKHHPEMKIRYHNYPHCGTDFNHTGFVRDKYAMAINEAKMLASCGGIYHLAMNKIFEAMGCGTVYVGEKPFGEDELHMKDGFNYVAVDSNDFKDKILHYLSKPIEMDIIVKNAQETFLKYHHIDARASDFVRLLKSVL